ncbi:hypothetical protein O181_003769 [Austropuccinia psidii MF-1]|uniref:Reverse transcriptase Ty1/copia-type domain-containing protein n=1 Tax=Austropuccinia psidii MF-1 TaxID=1389203 RepID=A0A9Q3BEL5_9BASI|nr:hypothetical protein [Austropuccinia psidii MF-1]
MGKLPCPLLLDHWLPNLFSPVPGSLKNCKQPSVSISTAEAEYKLLCYLTSEVSWFKQWCEEARLLKLESPILIYEDNQACIKTANGNCNLNNNRLKHVDTQLHLIKEANQNRVVCLPHISSAQMLADFLTKLVATATLFPYLLLSTYIAIATLFSYLIALSHLSYFSSITYVATATSFSCPSFHIYNCSNHRILSIERQTIIPSFSKGAFSYKFQSLIRHLYLAQIASIPIFLIFNILSLWAKKHRDKTFSPILKPIKILPWYNFVQRAWRPGGWKNHGLRAKFSTVPVLKQTAIKALEKFFQNILTVFFRSLNTPTPGFHQNWIVPSPRVMFGITRSINSHLGVAERQPKNSRRATQALVMNSTTFEESCANCVDKSKSNKTYGIRNSTATPSLSTALSNSSTEPPSSLVTVVFQVVTPTTTASLQDVSSTISVAGQLSTSAPITATTWPTTITPTPTPGKSEIVTTEALKQPSELNRISPILGGLLGGLISLSLIAFIVFIFFRRRRHREERQLLDMMAPSDLPDCMLHAARTDPRQSFCWVGPLEKPSGMRNSVFRL